MGVTRVERVRATARWITGRASFETAFGGTLLTFGTKARPIDLRAAEIGRELDARNADETDAEAWILNLALQSLGGNFEDELLKT